MNDEQVKQAFSTLVKKDPDWDIETMIDQVWHDLQSKVSRATIQAVILEIMPRYENARINTYVPILVQREAVDTLRPGLSPVQMPGKPRVDALSDGDTDGPLAQNTQLALSASG